MNFALVPRPDLIPSAILLPPSQTCNSSRADDFLRHRHPDIVRSDYPYPTFIEVGKAYRSMAGQRGRGRFIARRVALREANLAVKCPYIKPYVLWLFSIFTYYLLEYPKLFKPPSPTEKACFAANEQIIPMSIRC